MAKDAEGKLAPRYVAPKRSSSAPRVSASSGMAFVEKLEPLPERVPRPL